MSLTKPSISVRMNSGVQSGAQLSVALRDVRKRRRPTRDACPSSVAIRRVAGDGAPACGLSSHVGEGVATIRWAYWAELKSRGPVPADRQHEAQFRRRQDLPTLGVDAWDAAEVLVDAARSISCATASRSSIGAPRSSRFFSSLIASASPGGQTIQPTFSAGPGTCSRSGPPAPLQHPAPLATRTSSPSGGLPRSRDVRTLSGSILR
jgi:hypothetical protein